MLPLEGVAVVSLEQAIAAPFATRQLADLGARVIKVERPGSGSNVWIARPMDASDCAMKAAISRSPGAPGASVGLTELILQLLALGDVGGHAQQLAGAAVG